MTRHASSRLNGAGLALIFSTSDLPPRYHLKPYLQRHQVPYLFSPNWREKFRSSRQDQASRLRKIRYQDSPYSSEHNRTTVRPTRRLTSTRLLQINTSVELSTQRHAKFRHRSTSHQESAAARTYSKKPCASSHPEIRGRFCPPRDHPRPRVLPHTNYSGSPTISGTRCIEAAVMCLVPTGVVVVDPLLCIGDGKAPERKISLYTRPSQQGQFIGVDRLFLILVVPMSYTDTSLRNLNSYSHEATTCTTL
ncbi:hypothetical protein B0J13DRAFT_229114 [Dactylonectria estremocensis]|uniref:Uncharacterized protein n=1 Tax=Dactylonectria estremocensis TaxID=1079267 RepID=A0A9P9F801_9HYPO|nr:hypothetical protein B0J13DRAFT_229114 [Dactylonectria estremocensis]